MSFAKLVRALQEAPHSYVEMAEECGLHDRTIRKWITELHRQKLVYIGDWHVNSGTQPTPAWSWRLDAKQRDKARPRVAKSPVQRSREYRARNRIKAVAAALSAPLVAA